MRAYIFMDTLRRTIKYNGYDILGVMNITDVGHLTSDEDSGEDKMELSILINKFNIKGRLVSLRPFGNGNINDKAGKLRCKFLVQVKVRSKYYK